MIYANFLAKLRNPVNYCGAYQHHQFCLVHIKETQRQNYNKKMTNRLSRQTVQIYERTFLNLAFIDFKYEGLNS